MKLNELKNVGLLEDAEIESILKESISSEISQMVTDKVSDPFKTFHKGLVDNFAKTLKTWALMTLHDLKKGADFDDSKTYTQTLEKIINNPIGVSKQLIAKSVNQIAMQ